MGQAPNIAASAPPSTQYAHRAAPLARTAASASTASAGATHTQWWSQLTGDTSSPVSAQVSQPYTGWPARCRRTAVTRPAAPARAAAASHHHRPPARLADSRVNMPRSDWFARNPTNPVRPARRKSAPNHHCHDACGSAAKPTPARTANATAAVAAWRNRRVSTRYGMKISGTSLIPAARPIPAPFHHRRSGWHRSQITTAISSTSTWPTCRARCTGSVHSAAAVTASATPRPRRPDQPSARSVSRTDSPSAATLDTVSSQVSRPHGTQAQAAKTSAANGV